jgi:UDP-N-acetylmuramoyl-tripeptide--D-alanyl-D-alanine ligase
MVDTAHIRLSCCDVAAALGVDPAGGVADTAFTGVSTDSRTAGKGDLFVALYGDTFDGHDFVPAALAGGASGIVVRRDWAGESPAGVAVFRVADTLFALGELARFHRGRLSVRVVGITGSNGKTTTKEITASVVRTTYRTVRTEGNLNNLVGLPMMILSAPIDTEALVLEMGMNVPGEIARLAEIAAPDVGVVTNVGPVHLEGVGSIEGVVAEKAALLAALGPGGTAVFEGDTDYTEKLRAHTRARVITFGLDDKSDVRAEMIEDLGQQGTRAFFVLPGGAFETRVSIPGVHNLKNALAAAAVGYALGIPIGRIADGIRAAEPMTMRMEITENAAGLTVLNDSYNANPVSMRAALEFLSRQRERAGGRSIAVLGDMLELGDFTRSGHEAVGEAAARLGIDLVYVIGDFADDVRRGAAQAGRNEGTVRTYPKGRQDDLMHDLLGTVRPGDAVLVKGSRAMKMERVAQSLLKR